jgi:hypothetical protein
VANALFDSGRQAFLEGGIAILTVDIKLVFVDEDDDTPVPATDNFLDDIAAGARVATSGNFANKTSTAGVFDADDVVVSSVTGDEFESFVIYNDTPAAESGKHLIAYIDTATGLPFTPTGNNITVAWDNGANKIFKL